MLDAVARQLLGARLREDDIALDLGRDDLHRDVLVAEAHDEAVLGRIVLVLGLGDQALAGIVIGLAGLATLVLDLVTTAGGVSDSRRVDEYSDSNMGRLT